MKSLKEELIATLRKYADNIGDPIRANALRREATRIKQEIEEERARQEEKWDTPSRSQIKDDVLYLWIKPNVIKTIRLPKITNYNNN